MASDLDSPDPLGLSLTKEPISSPTKSFRKPTTPRKALAESHGNAQVQHFYLTTPRRNTSSSPTKSSARAQSAVSPWRIKVTVEAEPENMMPDSPSKRLDGRTITTTVPLKEAADSSPPAAKRGRGRPRKSLEGPVKRSGTPKPKAVGRKSATQDTMEENKQTRSTKTATTPKKARGRPRKSIGSSPARSEMPDVDKQENAVRDFATASSGIEPSSGASVKNIVPRKRGAPSNSSSTTPVKDKCDSLVSMHQSSGVQLPDSGSSISNGRPAKRRSLDKTEETEAESPSEELDELHTVNQQDEHFDISLWQSNLAKDDEDMWRSMIRQDSLALKNTAEEEGTSDQDEDDKDVAANDPTDNHQEFDSILESEGFSMVSVSSLPSAQQHSGSWVNHEDGTDGPKTRPTPAQVLSSVNPNTHSQLRTPSLASSTSSMPPPPIPLSRPHDSPRPMTKPTDGTPRLGRVVRAGIALQGVLSPSNSTSQVGSAENSTLSASSSAMSSKDRMDQLFDGFGAGTRRELRAGLRLGEELAKRQQRDQDGEKFKERAEDDVFSQDPDHSCPRLPASIDSDAYTLRLPGSEQQTQYPALQNPQLPSPAGSNADDEDRMSWKASSPMNEPVLPTLQQPNIIKGADSSPYVTQDTPLKVRVTQDTPLTVRIQRERAAVSKQIEEANTSQVIVIDSDDDTGLGEDEDEYDGDIWQEEANSSRSMPEPSPQIHEALLQKEPPKPRRSKLPNTWRKDRQIIYSDEVDQEQNVVQPKVEVVEAVPKDEIAKLHMHQKLALTTLSTPTEARHSEPAPVQGARKTQVKIDGGFQAVERPGWKKVKGRLQTPAKKTLKNVLAQQYEDMTAEDLNDEDEQTSGNNDERDTAATAVGSPTYPKLDEASHDEHLGDESGSVAENSTGSLDESFEYEEPLEYDREEVTAKPGANLSHTPPGSPPQHLYASIYQPPPTTNTTSWLSSLTSYIPTIRVPAPTPVPGADTLDPAIYNLQDYPPFYKHLPWEATHFRILRPYFDIQFAKPGTYPFNPYSRSASLLSLPVYARGNWGWVRYLSKSDLGLIDKFMQVLHIKGVERRPGLWGRGDGARIDELEVAKRVFELWQEAVLYGQAEVGEGNGTGYLPKSKVPFDPMYPKGPRRLRKEVCIIP